MNYLKRIYNYIKSKIKPKEVKSLPSKTQELPSEPDANEYLKYLSNMNNFGDKKPREEGKGYQIKNEILRKLYKDIHEKVEEYNKKLEKELAPQIPEKGKLQTIRKIKGAEKFYTMLQDDESKIPDELFIKYFNVNMVDARMNDELDRYKRALGISIKEGRVDIRDIVGNPKAMGKTYIEAITTLYSERGKKSIPGYMEDIKHFWTSEYNGEMCLYDTILLKVGGKFNNFMNNSHLTNICLLCSHSGLSDMQLDMPQGFVESLKNIKMNYENTPDDLEFVIMFNGIQEIMNENNIDVKFVLKDDSTKGINVIGIEGKDIEFSDTESMIEHVSEIFKEYNLGQGLPR